MKVKIPKRFLKKKKKKKKKVVRPQPLYTFGVHFAFIPL